jgi:hypothetical protein
VDDFHIYWTDEDEGIFRASVAGGERELLIPFAGALSLTWYNNHLFWTEDGRAERISRANKDGRGEVTVIDLKAAFGDQNYVANAIAIGANRIWWSDQGIDEMYSCRLDGSDAKSMSLWRKKNEKVWIFPNSESGESNLEPLAVTGTELNESGARIFWNAQSGDSYEILASDDLNSTSWCPLGISNDFLFTDVEAKWRPHRFYSFRKVID